MEGDALVETRNDTEMDRIESIIDTTSRCYDMEMRMRHDASGAGLGTREIAFLVGRAARAGGAVLELGCGTGRVSIPLAEAGIDVWALDLSEAILTELRRKASNLAAGVNARLHSVAGDMRAFTLDQRFAMVIAPGSRLES